MKLIVECPICGQDSTWNYFRATRDEIALVEEREDSCGCKRTADAQLDVECAALAQMDETED